ncbi:MAG: MFS transporter [Thermoproteus sp.]|nr:MFS transporter [Thermoproteus sp.]
MPGREPALIISSGVGWMFDAMDVLLLSYILAAAAQELGVGKAEAGLIILANNVGMLIGAFLFGRLADAVGRKPVFMATLVLYSLGTGATAFARTAIDLAAVRLFTGLGLGGELPVAASLVSELSRPEHRGRNVVLLESFWSIGSIAAAAVAAFAFPAFGWRAPLLALSATALYALGVRALVPESPLWLYKRDPALAARIAGEYGVPLAQPRAVKLSDMVREYGAPTAAIWLSWLLLAFGYYGAFLWLPTMVAKRGYGLVATFEYAFLMSLAQLPGYLTAAYLIDRLGRKPSIVLFFAGSAASAVAFALAPSTPALLAAGAALNFFNLGVWGLIYAYTPEVYPTELRATAMGSAGSMARVGMILGPLLPAVAGFGEALAAYSAAWLAAAAVVAVLAPETKFSRKT